MWLFGFLIKNNIEMKTIISSLGISALLFSVVLFIILMITEDTKFAEIIKNSCLTTTIISILCGVIMHIIQHKK